MTTKKLTAVLLEILVILPWALGGRWDVFGVTSGLGARTSTGRRCP